MDDDSPLEALKVAHDDDSPALVLLREWIRWWDDSDEAPAKLPNALHIRTAMFLLTEDMQTWGTAPKLRLTQGDDRLENL